MEYEIDGARFATLEGFLLRNPNSGRGGAFFLTSFLIELTETMCVVSLTMLQLMFRENKNDRKHDFAYSCTVDGSNELENNLEIELPSPPCGSLHILGK